MPNASEEGEESERRQTTRQRGAEQRQEQEQDSRESREVGSAMRSVMSKEFCCTNAFIRSRQRKHTQHGNDSRHNADMPSPNGPNHSTLSTQASRQKTNGAGDGIGWEIGLNVERSTDSLNGAEVCPKGPKSGKFIEPIEVTMAYRRVKQKTKARLTGRITGE